ncbi:MAG TPA: DNA mismatch repair endonuclease MutL [Dehalococcoidia bacterium]|nr:DNA mismatch repair endonuclease MutL [Dehalococcoidia bacterium]
MATEPVTDVPVTPVASGTEGRAVIRVLPPEVASRIAAGEVIERPASVLKELIENALDAGATVIEVEIEGGGIERLRVRDNGHGIPPEQIADAFERHATSKLRTEHDLFAVTTLGFRGEALAAVIAAADVDLITRPPDQPAAAVVRYRNGLPAGQGSAGAAPGTSIEVRDLFAALPARRRFLRGERAEARAITRAVTGLALAHPEVAFRLSSNGRGTLATPGGALSDAVAALHGVELAAALLRVDGNREGDESSVTVDGLVAEPSQHRASRSVHLVANGRVVQPGPLAFAVEQAYEGLLPRGRRPRAFLRVTVSPGDVDVNVHPAKAEVRFRHERLVFAAVRQAVIEALVGSSAPAGPVLAVPGGLGEALPAERSDEAPTAYRELPAQPLTGRQVIASAQPAEPDDAPAVAPAEGEQQAPLTLHERLPALRPLGQFGRTYLAAEAPDGLYLVDQHAAHERVRYEQVLAERERGVGSQALLDAVVATLEPTLHALAIELADELTALGWDLGETDGAAVIVRAVPSLLAGGDPVAALTEYLDRLQAEDGTTPDRAAATLACRSSVRAGDRLDEQQQRALLVALEATAQPMTCPHGRPTALHLSGGSIERSFGRR